MESIFRKWQLEVFNFIKFEKNFFVTNFSGFCNDANILVCFSQFTQKFS